MTTQERIDRELLNTSEMGALHFVVPDEIKHWLDNGGHSTYHASKKVPGVYIGGWGQHVSPRLFDHGSRRLTREQALAYAGLLDQLVQPRLHGGARDERPTSFAAFVAAWYDALGRALSVAFDVAQQRATDLRTVRAAITGEV